MIAWKKRLNQYGISNWVIVLLVGVSMVSITAEIFSIGMFLPLFEIINQHGSEALENSDSEIVKYIRHIVIYLGLDFTIETILILSFILFLFSKTLLYITTYIQLHYRSLILKNMKDRLLNSYLQATASYYDTVGIGDFTNSSSIELSAAVSGTMLPIKFIITIMSGTGSIILLLAISPKLTLISICVVGIGILLPLRWVKATTHAGKKNSRYSSDITSFLLNRLQSPRLVRLSNTSDSEERSYSFLTEKQRKLTVAIQLLKARIALVLEPMVIGISLIMFYVALVVLEMSVSAILLYMLVMVRIVPVVTNIMTQKQSLNRAVGPIQAIERLLDNIDTSVKDRKKDIYAKDTINKINTIETLRLENIDFSYDGCTNLILSNIEHVFNKSTLTAIVGPSGGGKTTFVDIISGYRKQTSGSIFVNDINADKYNYESLMNLVSYIPQDPQIFDGTTVYEHISYGMQNATMNKVINASKLSDAYNFIKDLPQGFNTVLLGGSSSLSGGQKQRLDLSRALLRDAPVLIMDEPTGNLDILSEKKLMLSINKIREETGKIIIIIAHRIYTIIDAENIIVLEGGRISGTGTHSELLLSNSWYKSAMSEL
jgi:ABC-type multidrug transport system fused ATPase/permease subunit